MTRPEENRRLVRRYFDLLNGGDPSIAEEALSENMSFSGPRAPEGVRGRAAFMEFVSELRRDSPDLRFVENLSVVEGNRVASVFTMTRTHRNNQGNPEVIATEGVDLFHVADGRIERVNAYFDRFPLLVKTGVISPPS